MDSDVSVVLYIECEDSSEEGRTITFFNAVEGIELSWLRNTFLPAAAPVLGITAINEAYYLSTRKTNLN